MTGSHYQRLSMSAVLFPNSSKGLHPDEVTIADMLKGAGYKTKCVGKWHLPVTRSADLPHSQLWIRPSTIPRAWSVPVETTKPIE